jgi:hypothetical protein
LLIIFNINTMKKVIYFAFLLTGLSVSTFAHTTSAQGIEPGPTFQLQAKFAHDYASAENIVWSSSPRFKKASFDLASVQMSAFYNRLDEYVATTQLVEVTQLAPTAIKNLIKQYPGYQMGQIIKYTGSDEAYFVNLRNDKENFLVIITADAQVNYFKDLR